MVNPLEIVIVGLYLCILLGIGIVASKKIKNCDDFICAGRSLGFWLFLVLMIGTVCSGMSLLGVSGFGYSRDGPGYGNNSSFHSQSRSVSYFLV